ncbi:exosortase F system-associated protein [Flavobacterium sp. NRK F10]|uniref:Exosortase F system-associated protein n=1 Tax=Flavobacterium sediminis TaxID=2201181 RepID=A0A2U8QW52_9FLAO|nr:MULTISPECIES: exosortase F system-associated protein [Flavobacterium]AWM14134.1 exosortase F system-associated protein [Flavobacterium sediminis]MCO6175325.1 exosortase F system-associated protein [Flavobacterium sp. NRK F10]
MPKEILLSKKNIAGITGLLLLLVGVRVFEDALFYDPFINFFKTEFQHQRLPDFDAVQLFLGLLFRYSVNTVLSLGILCLLFRQKQILVVSFWMYVLFFILLSIAFFWLLRYDPDYMMLFYVRRFLIQPLFLVLFIPAFYYQKFAK